MTKQQIIILIASIYAISICAYFGNFSTIFACLLIVILSILTILKKLSFRILIACLIFCLFGTINCTLQIKDYDKLVSCTPNNATINARVVTIPTTNNSDRTKFYANVFQITVDENTISNINEKTLVTIYDTKENLSKLKIGDIVKINGKLNTPSTAQNPFQFDYAKYLKSHHTFTTFYATENSFTVEKRADKLPWNIISKLNDTRSKIIKRQGENIHSPNLEILGGIVFGDDAVNPTDEIRQSFIDSGLLHILAASGMNVTLIFAIWFFISQRFRINYRLSIISGMAIIIFYTCMTGFGASILRATLMLLFILLGKLIDKDTETISLLFLVGLLMLIVNPAMINDVGFQLSFVVTFGLLFSSKLFNYRNDNKIFNTIFVSVLVPFIAQLYAAPLQMYYFNTFALYSVLANILIVPVLSIVSFLGFISSIFAAITPISAFICKISSYILNPLISWIVFVADKCSHLPNSIVQVHNFGLYSLILYYTLLIILSYCLLNSKLNRKFVVLLITLALIFTLTFIKIPSKNTEIIFFSVGNADSILIKSPDNKYFLIDTGRLPYRSINSSAKQIILRYLDKNQINEIETMVLTHFDSDHSGGAVDMLNNKTIKSTHIINRTENTNIAESIMSTLNDNRLNYSVIEDTKEIYKTDNFKLTNYVNRNAKSENDASIITVLETNGHSIVFMGDCTADSFKILPDEIKNNIDLLKIGHHGAKNTFNEEMAERTKSAIISTGQNQYGHPTKEVINILENNKIPYLRTDNNNAIKVIIRNEKMEFYSYYPHLKKFVKN